jgi:starch phosphorylase
MLGFARRFATYKPPNLLLHDPDRLVRILCDTKRPVQLIIAGKAHPLDLPGQALIGQWHTFLQRPEVRGRVVFLSDYDMLLAQELVQGVDLWINTPRRPWEACGTSGMKVLVNGGLNLSELDGWWAEAYSPEVGWAIGDGKEHGDDPAWDDVEAESLYSLLEREVVPEFYERDEKGMPAKWLGRIRESMARLTPEFSASRAIREYTENHYLPAASDYRERADDDSKLEVETQAGQYVFLVRVFPGDLSPQQIEVELYADPVRKGTPAFVAMTASNTIVDSGGTIVYSAQVPASRPAGDYTPRIRPFHPDVAVPLEVSQILWQR